jgi:hypothetical protein
VRSAAIPVRLAAPLSLVSASGAEPGSADGAVSATPGILPRVRVHGGAISPIEDQAITRIGRWQPRVARARWSSMELVAARLAAIPARHLEGVLTGAVAMLLSAAFAGSVLALCAYRHRKHRNLPE